jgi:hypothetical protein
LKTQIRTLSIEANHGTVNPLGRVFHRAIIGRPSRLIRCVRSHGGNFSAPPSDFFRILFKPLGTFLEVDPLPLRSVAMAPSRAGPILAHRNLCISLAAHEPYNRHLGLIRYDRSARPQT